MTHNHSDKTNYVISDGDFIQHTLELRGSKNDKHWVIVYRNKQDNTIAEFVGETISSCLSYLLKDPNGATLKFRTIKGA